MNEAIVNILESDTELITLLNPTPEKPKIYPLEHSDVNDDPYIVFTVSPFLAGDATTQYRVEFRIVSKNLNTVEQIQKALMRLFRRKSGFISEGETIYRSLHAGGGLIKNPDTNMIEQFLIFNVIAN